jgi:hypothetical protein
MIYFRIQVFGSGFLQFGHLHSVGHVDFNWAEAWVIVNGLLLDIPMSNEVYAVGDITNLTFQQVRRSHHNLIRRSKGYWMLRHRLLLNIFFYDEKPLQGKATSYTHPCRVNLEPVYSTSSTQIGKYSGFAGRLALRNYLHPREFELRPDGMLPRLKPLPLEPTPWCLLLLNI